MNKSIKLISLNVALFEKNNERLAQLLNDEKPDIICFQEVTRKISKTTIDSFVSLNAIDTATPELPYSFFSPIWALQDFKKENFHNIENYELKFGGFMEFGNFIKSKYKIIKSQNIFVQNSFTYITDWSKWPEEDYRAVQVTDLEINTSQKLRILNYHGIWTPDKQGNDLTKSATEKIYQLASEVTYPSLICGDFNLFPDTESMKILNENFTSLVDKYNIPTTRPASNEHRTAKRNLVDYIFISKGITANNFKVIDENISDHFALVVEFSI